MTNIFPKISIKGNIKVNFIDLPGFGDPNSPANSYLAQEFLTRNYPDIGIPNVVTSILASYRGFDTYGEVGVVFIAGVAVALLLGFGERSLAASLEKNKRGGR